VGPTRGDQSAPPAPSADEVAARVEAVWERIRQAGGDRDRIRLVAVTKAFGADVVEAALAAGLVDLGENYAQELLAKQEAVAGEGQPRWHFIGRLQSNKVRKLAPFVSLWQSVDRLSLGEEIARRSPGAAVLAQVDLTEETTKGGCPPAQLAELLEGLTALGLDVRGLMTVGPLDAVDAPERARPVFRELRRLADAYGLAERSMGMSSDLEVAVEEGSTMVRVGSALFGPRPGPAGMRH
jgi:pyridoxal phosphate enzyme (YggS family)